MDFLPDISSFTDDEKFKKRRKKKRKKREKKEGEGGGDVEKEKRPKTRTNDTHGAFVAMRVPLAFKDRVADIKKQHNWEGRRDLGYVEWWESLLGSHYCSLHLLKESSDSYGIVSYSSDSFIPSQAHSQEPLRRVDEFEEWNGGTLSQGFSESDSEKLEEDPEKALPMKRKSWDDLQHEWSIFHKKKSSKTDEYKFPVLKRLTGLKKETFDGIWNLTKIAWERIAEGKVLEARSQFFLCLRRLKCSEPFSVLGSMFGVCGVTAGNIFSAGLDILIAHVVKVFLVNRPDDVIRQHMDEDWKRFVGDNILIMWDGTHFFRNVPQNYVMQYLQYSQ